jgi:exodeoxyribonuclease VII large subunit
MFRRAAALLGFDPQDGGSVEVRGRLTVYEARGELQLVVESMQRAGAGLLLERFLRLKADLEREGLFAAERKRPIAAFPRSLAIVTSLGAAALHDVLTTLQRRAPHVRLLVYPATVQGAEAPSALAAAIELAGRQGLAETLLLVRGGGSLEDLWAFNEPVVVRAVAASRLPVIAGVGHETDTTLVDFAADLRAATPTAAAELAALPQAQAQAALRDAAGRLVRAMTSRLDAQAQRIDRAALRLAQPAQRVAMARQRLESLREAQVRAAAARCQRERDRQLRLAQRLQAAAAGLQARAGHRAALLAARLGALDPALVLGRGYAWLADERGRALTSVGQLGVGQAVQAQLRDGRAALEVLAIELRADEP